MTEERDRTPITEPADTTDVSPSAQRGTAESMRTNVGSAVPASRPASDDSLLLRQILAELRTPNIASTLPTIRHIGSDESLLLRQILEELEGINRRLEAIERKLT